jgi:hypothetical protein
VLQKKGKAREEKKIEKNVFHFKRNFAKKSKKQKEKSSQKKFKNKERGFSIFSLAFHSIFFLLRLFKISKKV